MNTVRPCRRARRRGSAYILVLSVATMLILVGMASLTGWRLRDRTTRLEQDWNEAGVLAASAVDQALVDISDDAWWRTVNDDYEAVFSPEVPFHRGWLSWRYEDLVDDDLDDNDADPVRIHGRGRVGLSTRAYSVVAWPTGETLDVLRTAIHAGDDLDATGVLDVRGGPASANDGLACDQLLGDAEAATVTTPGAVSGSVTAPAPAKQMPSRAVWSLYRQLSVSISFGSLVPPAVMEDVVLSPGHNPYNADERSVDGLYHIKVPSFTTFRIRDCRIHGTLLVELSADASLEIQSNVVWRPARADFPALIVYTKSDSGTDVDITCSGTLDELASGTNFNPAHTPYFGDTDTDASDVYPASLNGVIHVIRETSLPPSRKTTIDAVNRITGCIIAEGDIDTMAGSIVVADPTLVSRPPLGYTTKRDVSNLLVNGDMEGGLAGWSAVGTPTVLVSDGGGHTGAKRMTVKDRGSASHGVRQDITGKVVNGAVHNVDVWLRMEDDPEDVELALKIDSTGEGIRWFIVTAPAVPDGNWTRVMVPITPTWTGTLNAARFIVKTTTTMQDFRIDDAMITLTNGPPPASLVTVPGTWQAESTDP